MGGQAVAHSQGPSHLLGCPGGREASIGLLLLRLPTNSSHDDTALAIYLPAILDLPAQIIRICAVEWYAPNEVDAFSN